jgi:hypothetical protein
MDRIDRIKTESLLLKGFIAFLILSILSIPVNFFLRLLGVWKFCQAL